MDHFISSDPPHADVRRAPAADLLALANYEHEPPLSIAETMYDTSWLAGSARHLVGSVRTAEALEALDAEPHPPEPLDLDALETDDVELAVHLSPDKNGRDTVMLALGDLRAMQLTSISVPDAHRLVAALGYALNAPLASVS